MKLVLGAEADLVGYWSDGTVGIEITATLHNQGTLALNDAVPLSVTCRLADRAIDQCSQQASVSLPDGFGPVTETLVIRSPAGELAFDIDYGEKNAHTLLIDAPSRIVGVHRDVWECFKDQSNRGTGRDEDEGIGCGAWNGHIVQKWPQGSPVKVWINGPRAFTAEFEDVLAELSPVVNLQFERVTSRGDADVSAWVGLTVSQFRGTGAECYNVESMGCAHIESEWSGRVRGGEIIVFNLWPDKGKDLGDFGDWRSSLFRSAMLHEAVHVFGRMDHRTEPFSLMNRAVHERAELTPMDEALLRLHGHEMVKVGMAMDVIERQIVLNDELLDPQPQSSGLRAHTLVLKAYGALRDATSARFRVRSSTPGCDEDSGWAEYQVGNLSNGHPYFEWVRLDNGRNQFYVLRHSAGEFEYWGRSGSRWGKTDSDSVASTLNGWRGELTDPHYMLTSVLNYADWSAAEVSVDSDGNAMLSVNLDLSNADDAPGAEGVKVVMLIDEGSHAVREYAMDWDLGGGSCDDHRVEATEGQLRNGFSFPEAIRLGSASIDNCNAESLGSVSGMVTRSGVWTRECESPDAAIDGYARRYRFTLSQWAYVRIESASHDRASTLRLLKGDGPGDSPALEPDASGAFRYDRSYFNDTKLWTRWAQLPLAPGSYTVETVTGERTLPVSFELTVSAQPTPPPPYRFKSLSAGEGRTCGLLLDGTPVCWGRTNRVGEIAVMPRGPFAAISTYTFSCAIRPDGSPVCWDFEYQGKHTCETRSNGATRCTLDDQTPPSTDDAPDMEADDAVLDSVAIGVIAGYFDMTPPVGERLTSISAGWNNICGTRPDGSVICWGSRNSGNPPDETFVSVSTGLVHSCGVRADGSVKCWGDDTYGQVSSAPRDGDFVGVSTGASHTCGLLKDGSVACWGRGQIAISIDVPGDWNLGDVYGVDQVFIPAPPRHERVASLSPDGGYCGLRADGTPVCWPSREYGLLPTPEGERFESISSSPWHACGLHEGGAVSCWGDERHGQTTPPSGVNLNDERTTRACSHYVERRR